MSGKDKTSSFTRIREQILDWNNSEVHGEGVYIVQASSPGHFAHVILKINISKDGSAESSILWNVKEYEIPIGFRPYIEDVLKLFNNHVNEVKGAAIPLIFEVYGGTYSITGSRSISFTVATKLAIANSFDKNISLNNPNNSQRLIRAKIKAREYHEKNT